MTLEFALVYVTVWVAMLAWLVGAGCRWMAVRKIQHHSASQDCPARRKFELGYRWSWFCGSCLLFIHIVSSYGYVHHWSHEAALRATAKESLRVTGIAAPWGVYVNFAFAVLWTGYSMAMIVLDGRIQIVDSVIFVFLFAIVISATLVF